MTSSTKKCPHCNEEIQATALKCRFCQEWLVASAKNAQQGRFGDLHGQEIGPYHIIDRLGDGGMGSVWKGEHVALGRTVAVKVLHSHLLSYHEAVQRFLAEARGLVRLGSPYLVEILDLGSLPDGRPYFVMEYLEGINLEDWIAANKPVPIDSIFEIGDQLLQAMMVVHAKNIVHRDLKPQNIMVLNRQDGSIHVKLLDFGIAKFVQDESSSAVKLTNPGMTVGTPLYMSPEQAGGVNQIDGRSDLYSIGILLYETSCSKPPFYHDNGLKVMEMHHKNPVPPPREKRPELPEALEQWLLKALTKKRALRFQTAEEAREALLACKISIPLADREFRDAETGAMTSPAVMLHGFSSSKELPTPTVTTPEPPKLPPLPSAAPSQTGPDVANAVRPADVSASDIVEISSDELEEAVEEAGAGATIEEPPREEPAPARRRGFWGFAAAGVAALALLYLLWPSTPTQPAPVTLLATTAPTEPSSVAASIPVQVFSSQPTSAASIPVVVFAASQPSPEAAPTPAPEPAPEPETVQPAKTSTSPVPLPVRTSPKQPVSKPPTKKSGPPGVEALINPYKKR